MARLNDPPAPATESLDALKRRFIRQNREIARVNSTQSQRIRNLETEISRLLAENIAIREQAIAAAAEAERLRTANRLGRDVIQLKSRLETKLGEVTALIEELGRLPEAASRKSGIRRRKSGLVQDGIRSPDERDWRNGQTLGATVAAEREDQEGRLPAILEDKYYPRRTLETEELRILTMADNMEGEDTESPDLGPPPVAHFEVADPIYFDSAKSPKRVSGGIIPNNDSELMALSKNLEVRRRRRTSSLLQDMPNIQDQADDSRQPEGDQSDSGLKPIMKRKFEASEIDREDPQLPRNDGFEYQRREPAPTARPKSSRFAPRPARRAQLADANADATSPRKVLAPKSTNSPAKKSVTISNEKPVTLMPSGQAPAQPKSHRSNAPAAIRIAPVQPDQLQQVEMDDAVLHQIPKTPAAELEDMISPPSSAMDTTGKARSTEVAIINSVEDVLSGSIGRGSRRARAAVSYAEPNLRDKMRRPDKKLVGAVEGLNKTAGPADRDSSREAKRESSTEPGQHAPSSRAIPVKSEARLADDGEQAWKDLPEARRNEEAASPLQDKHKASGTSLSELRKKRSHSESEGTRTQKSKATTSAQDELDKAVSRLSIYDPPSSSPISQHTEDKDPKPVRALSTKTTAAASNSSHNPFGKPSNTTSAVSTRTRRFSVQSTPDPSVLATSDRSLTRTGSTLSMRESTTGKENVGQGTSKLKRTSSVQTMGEGVEIRTVNSRRRSMMV